MTSQELKQKLDAAQEKVNKRLTTISKICKKLNINETELLSKYNENKNNYLSHTNSKTIVLQFINYKEDNYWNSENYEFNEKINQLIDNLCKLREVETVRNNWKEKYILQLNKEEAPKIKILMDFLDEWKAKANSWYHENANYIVDKMNEFHQNIHKFLLNNNVEDLKDKEQIIDFIQNIYNPFIYQEYRLRPRYHFKDSCVDEYDYKLTFDDLTRELTDIKFYKDDDNYRNYYRCFERELTSGEYKLVSFNEEKLNKILAQEKQRKYEDLVNRISNVVGEIQDVSNLSIGNKNGELNGIVKGSDGSARIETIGAGGWNIQVFHYRILIHKIK